MNELRDQLPGIGSCTYLNYATSGTSILLDAAKKMAELSEQLKEPLPFHVKEWKKILEDARETVAYLISAKSSEIAFTTGTSHGLSLIANGIKWKKGDEVIFPSDEFPSNRYVWENLKEKGIFTRSIEPSLEIPFERQLEKVESQHIRLVSCSAISYRDGRRLNIKEIAKVCRKRGWLLAVDAIQALGAIPIDVREWDCDFLATGGQKWVFGPVATGFLYLREELIDDLYVSQVGWGSFESSFDYHKPLPEFAKGAKRFEPGYVNLPATAALAKSIEVMNKIGFEKIYNRIESLTERAMNEIGSSVITPKERGGIVTVGSAKASEIQKKATR